MRKEERVKHSHLHLPSTYRTGKGCWSGDLQPPTFRPDSAEATELLIRGAPPPLSSASPSFLAATGAGVGAGAAGGGAWTGFWTEEAEETEETFMMDLATCMVRLTPEALTSD